MEEKSYNQQQYLRSYRHKTRCRQCKKQIVWMKTFDGRSVAVNPLKVQSTTPGERILGEDGIILVNVIPKCGWTFHLCQVQDSSTGTQPPTSNYTAQSNG